MPAEDRFWPKVQKSEGCWEWTGALGGGGYGAFHDGTRQRVAHRYSYELLVGPIADGLMACHRCDNPKCVNPEHLFLGTASDNERDKYAKGRQNNVLVQRMRERTHCPQGHPLSGDNLLRCKAKRSCRTCRNSLLRRRYRAGKP